MADNLTIPGTHDTAEWVDAVKLIDTDEPVQGGIDGVDNQPNIHLAKRSRWLKAQIDAVIAWAELEPDTAVLTQLKDAIAAKLAAATTTVAGLIELATNTEVQTGTDPTRAVTPAGLSARTATETRTGIIELATNAEVLAGADTARAVTPAGVKAAIDASTTEVAAASTDAAGIIEIATIAEALTGTDTTLAVTPAGLAAAVTSATRVGTIIAFAASAAPSGFLKCNGAEIDRTTYAALFAAIGTAFGAGDGASTFNLPDLRGEFLRGWDDGRGIDVDRVFGSEQLDAMQGHIHNGTVGGSGSGVQSGTNWPRTGGSVGSPVSDGVNGDPRTAAETRPRNVAVLYCIKY